MHTIVQFEPYHEAAVLRRLLGHDAQAHAVKTLRKCESSGDGDGAARWRAIGAAIDSLDRKIPRRRRAG